MRASNRARGFQLVVRRSRGPVLGALLLLLTGCGYSAGSLTRPGYERVYLPMFGNETFYRDLERDLTKQVARELSSRPGIFIAPLDSADIVLRGTVVEFRQRVLSEDDRDRVRESSAWTRVRIEILDARDAQRVLKSFEVADRAEFQVARGENLASATDESYFDLARQVVDALETELRRTSARNENGASGPDRAPEPTGDEGRAEGKGRAGSKSSSKTTEEE